MWGSFVLLSIELYPSQPFSCSIVYFYYTQCFMATAISIPRKKLSKLAFDNEASAKSVNLIYVSDEMQGYTRKKQGKGFAYYLGKKKITDKKLLDRFKQMVIPPAWQKVWICKKTNGHLLVTGYDAKGRKQYIYHPMWIALRSQTKFSHMYDFGNALPKIRKQIAKDLEEKELHLNKVLAVVVSIMQYTNARIGNIYYEKQNGSYGLTTLKDDHAKITTKEVQFDFIGKKGVAQSLKLKDKKLAKLVQQCKDIPGEDLFQYYDEDGDHSVVDSGMVNDYIKSISDDKFTAKDFRTWFGSLKAMQSLKEIGCCDAEKERKKRIVDAVDRVAKQLGNTRSVCRKYYIHPAIINCYNEGKLDDFFHSAPVNGINKYGLNKDEKIMMKILDLETKIPICVD